MNAITVALILLAWLALDFILLAVWHAYLSLSKNHPYS
jgi:hypothetical protein